MFHFEDYEKLIDNPEEAKKYCLLFSDSFEAQAELIMLDIIFFHEKPFAENYISLQKYHDIFKRTGNKHGYLRVVSNLAFYSLDLNDISNTRKYALSTLKYLPDYTEVKIVLAFANIKLNKDIEDSFEFLKTQCNNQELTEEIRKVCFSAIAEYFGKKGLFEEGYKFFEKCFIYSNDKYILRREMLNMVLGQETDILKIRDAYENYAELIESDEKTHLIFFISDRLISEKYFEEANRYLKELESLELQQSEKDILLSLTARIKGMSKDYDGAMNDLLQISEKEREHNPYIPYLMATTIFMKDDRRYFKEGIDYVSKTFELNPCEENFSNLINAYLIAEDYEKAEQTLKSYHIKFVHPIFMYYKGVIYMKKGQWNKAEQHLFNYMVKIKYRVPEYAYAASRNTPIKKALLNDYKVGKTLNDIRHQAIMSLHGFGTYEVNPEHSIKLLEEHVESDSFDSCCMAVLGNAYLRTNKIDKAINLFKKGHDRYVNYQDNCTCCTGFYCYCLANGIGIDKNEEEAYKILSEINPVSISDIGVYTYVDLSIKNNKNLDKAWNMLENLHEWRYNIGKYYMMLKLAPLLNKKIGKIKRMFKKCLKHVPLAEKIHYMDNPETFYLTNI